MGIATGQWRARIGSWCARFKFQLPNTDTNSISASSAIFHALVLAVLLVVDGVELNPEPNTQSCCELCGVNVDTINERELVLDQREEAVLVTLQQREAACDSREQDLERREASLQSRVAAVWRREKEKNSGTPAVNLIVVDVVRALLEKEIISKTGLLEWAVLFIAPFVIEEDKVDVNAKDSSSCSELFLAVENGLLAAVKLLLPLFTEDVVKGSAEGLAFHSAVSKGHTNMVKCLISDSQALPRKKDKNGHLDIMKFLYHEAQANVEVKQNDGWTALHLAAQYGHSDTVKFLL